MNTHNLTKGSIFQNVIRFSLPYLLSCFLQTFYGLADLFITGQFHSSCAITAVSIGSQITHMLTVIIAGLAMGSTVSISRAIGGEDTGKAAKSIGNSILLFAGFAILSTAVLLLCTTPLLTALSVPEEALSQTRSYLTICFLGIPFIVAYNVLSSFFRGLGDSKSPMYFVAAAGVINIGLDYLLIGPAGLGAAGAAAATVLSQAMSVFSALIYIRRKQFPEMSLSKKDLTIHKPIFYDIVKVGVPIAFQDGLIQVGFLVITVIANRRGVEIAAAVGIVEKIICFLFLIPSAMLSTVSAIAAQNAGAGLHDRSRKTLWYGIGICAAAGVLFTVLCQFYSEPIIRLFDGKEPQVIRYGTQYLRTYVLDCIFAGVHFCFSGYFFAYKKPMISFFHNLTSILFFRIPGAILAAVFYPDNLAPMGLAAPIGSLYSALVCIFVSIKYRNSFDR